MRFLELQLSWTGISIMYIAGMLIPMMCESLPDSEPDIIFEKSLLAMIGIGVGEIFGSIL